MVLANLFDRFRQPTTPEAEQRKTTMQLLDDEKFLDFLDKVEAQSGRRVFAGLSLDEPATDELMEWHARYKEQEKVAKQMTEGVKQEFREAGLKFDDSLKIPSNKPYRERYVAFFYPQPGDLADAQAELPDAIRTKLADLKAANLPDPSNNHPGGTAAEDAAAAELQGSLDSYRENLKAAEADIDRMKKDAGLDPLVITDVTDEAGTHAELSRVANILNTFTISPTVDDAATQAVVEQHRDELVKIIEAEKAKITPGNPPDPKLVNEVTSLIDTQEKTVVRQQITDARKNLDVVDAALTEVFQAKETMGSRLDAIRAEVSEQAVSNPAAFDGLKERMARLDAKDKEVQALRRSMEQSNLADPNTQVGLQDMRRALKVVDRFGSDNPLLGKVRSILNPSYRKAANQLEKQFDFSATTDRQGIRDQLAHVETLLQTPSTFQQAVQEAELLSSGIKADVPTLNGFGDAVRVALQESLQEKLNKGDLAGVAQARGQIENARYATLINEEVDVDQMKQMIEDASVITFQRNLVEQLNGKGGKNIGTILRGFENLAAKLQATKSIESQSLLDFVKRCLDDIAGDMALGQRTRQYAELIRNTVEARYA